jgi:DNA-binding MarR family transcriptional regulator
VIDPSKVDKNCGLPRPELENVDPLTARVFHALGRVMHLNRLVMARTMGQHGVQSPEAIALTLLARNDGFSQRELAEILHLSHPRVSTILNTLEKAGLVLRRPDENDRRLVRVFLTDEGRRSERVHRSVMGAYVERTVGALPEADRLELERLLNDLAGSIKVVLQEGHDAKTQGEDAKTR